MENLSARYAEKIYNMSRSQFPSHVTDKARECFIDYLSVVVGGCEGYSKINNKFIEENRFSGTCHVVGNPQTVDLTTAVMINAFNAHVLELDDSHRVAMTHLGAPIFSALLGVAEIYNSSLDSLLRAAVIGYEASIRLANTIQPSHKKRGFHVSGTCCTIGCAMGIAAMLGYSLEEMKNVLSASATSAAGLLGVSTGKSQQKPYNVANAAVAGVNAALYGKLFHGAEDILGGPRGFLKVMSDYYQEEKLFEDGFAIEGIYQKLYAACRHCHAPMEAMLQLRKEQSFDSDEIEGITVHTYDLAIGGHDHTNIVGVSSAKQSIPYGVAVACKYQDCGMDAFTAQKVSDKALLDLVRKVKVKEDSELTALVPGKRAAVVTVCLADGKKYARRVDFPKGEPENPITQDEFQEKFYTLTASAGMKHEKGTQVLDFVHSCGKEPVKKIYQWLSMKGSCYLERIDDEERYT